MTMAVALIDTDILSEVLKGRNARVLEHATEYLSEHGRFSFSAITFYEIVRGLRANNADKQLSGFLELASSSHILPISLTVMDRAADLWAEAHRRGYPRNDADIIIAASALVADRTLITGNKSHFGWIPQLRVEDWR